MMVVLLIVALAIPLGLDLYMPVPVENPITEEKIELGIQPPIEEGKPARETSAEAAQSPSDGAANQAKPKQAVAAEPANTAPEKKFKRKEKRD